ncbi:MAG: glycoside hydrolase family 2 [Prevotella sp.]|nr:glycoside hydrolase family 2 [Prevotella sp.]
MKRILSLSFLLITIFLGIHAQQITSVAGFYPLQNSGRVIYNFNQGWRFLLGDAAGAEAVSFDDSRWEVVCAPHSSRLEPAEASGCRNYQGVTWYRKHFVVPADMKNKVITVHFEAIMGKQWIYVNGRQVKEHLGGYLPITIDLSKEGVKAGDNCLIAVKADNSDDKSYPPGKKQSALDFAYHGGMYRDVWLIGKPLVGITDAIEANQVAGGGVFVHYDKISEKSADVYVNVDVMNNTSKKASPTIAVSLKDADGKIVKTIRQSVSVPAGKSNVAMLKTTLKNPHLWSPETPYLYIAEVKVLQGKNAVDNDGVAVRLGIRSFEFRGRDGFWLNGKPYHQLVGGNRHQDFAYVGNALPNSQQWRDAKRLKDVGMNIIRAAHYPQDPSFMDACDELGIFIIVPTPGWQYWNKEPQFAERVHQNTREIIRRDRNHPCVLMWEPILNETRYPEDFALQALQITKDEYPYPYRPVAAADMNSAGVKDNYDVLYGWPEDVTGVSQTGVDATKAIKANADPSALPNKCIFTREFGEYVDDWYAHNNLNRAARFWGEKPMLIAALSLADTYGQMFLGQRQFIGGAQWHPFDHQRGYHPDPYWGGIYDAFRQKKYAAEMFRSMGTDTPMVYIAHEMTQFSDQDVVVFSNCDSVRLTVFEGDIVKTLPVVHNPNGMPNQPVVFKNCWDFWKARDYSYKKRDWQHVSFLVEGIKNGKVVCSEKKMPSRRSTKIRLRVDDMGKQLMADGSDFIVVVAEITDDNGNVRRLAKDNIFFTVEGEGELIGDASIMANPRIVEWGSAPILVRSTNKAGKITITARSAFEGNYAPAADTLVIESTPALIPMCYKDAPRKGRSSAVNRRQSGNTVQMTDEERRKTLEEVEIQQKEFGIK